MPNHSVGDLLHTQRISGLSRVRTELLHLLVVPFLPPHPVETDRQLRAIATLAIPRSRRIAKCRNFRRQSGSLRTVACAASTSKNRRENSPVC